MIIKHNYIQRGHEFRCMPSNDETNVPSSASTQHNHKSRMVSVNWLGALLQITKKKELSVRGLKRWPIITDNLNEGNAAIFLLAIKSSKAPI